MARTTALSLLALCGYASASAHQLHEKREYPWQGSVERQRVDGDVLLPMRIGLKQNDAASSLSEDWLMDVSDPKSANYGKFWTSDQVVDAFQPHEDSVSAVIEWLESEGIVEVTHTDNKQWLAFDLPASRAEELFKTEYYEHQRPNGGFDASCDEYHLPEHLGAHVDFIMPGVQGSDITGRSARSRDALRKRSLQTREDHVFKGSPSEKGNHPFTLIKPPSNPDSLEDCDKVVTPACIRALYDVPLADTSVAPNPDNHIGLFEEGDLFYQGDLDRFWDGFAPYIANGTAPVFYSIDGGESPPTAPNATGWNLVGGEADLDIQVALPIVYPQCVNVYQTDDPYWASVSGYQVNGTDYGFFNTFLDALDGSYCTYKAYGEKGDSKTDPQYPDPRKNGYKGNLQCGVYKPPYIISTSYSAQELDFTFNYQKRQCNEYLKLAMQGTTIFVASGDQGVGPCFKPHGRKIYGTWQISGCPWVTNVGSTQIPVGGTVNDTEIASNRSDHQGNGGFSSGGGFSLIFDAPKYQQQAIDTYFAGPDAPNGVPYFENGNYNSSTGVYNRNGRAYPDISAVGVNIAISLQDQFILIGGTSASAPISAAIFNRIVEERLRAGKGPLGFLNPALYQNPDLLNDITSGSNPFCGFAGFETAEGWDPVTGLGTPNYPKLLNYFLSA